MVNTLYDFLPNDKNLEELEEGLSVELHRHIHRILWDGMPDMLPDFDNTLTLLLVELSA